MSTSIVIVRPMPRPAIALNAPPGSTAFAKTASTRKIVRMISTTRPLPAPMCRRVRHGAERRRAVEEPAQERGGGDGAGELRHPVGDRERPGDPPGRDEAERDRRVEVAAGDVAEVRDHEPDREAVGERDRDDVVARDDAGASADEDQRECADELRDAAAADALIHRAGGYEARSDGIRYARSVAEPQPVAGFDVECPHCHKSFSAKPMEGIRGALPRLQVPALQAVRAVSARGRPRPARPAARDPATRVASSRRPGAPAPPAGARASSACCSRSGGCARA